MSDEVTAALRDLREAGCVERWVKPKEFVELVRSSYRAGRLHARAPRSVQ